MESSGDDYSDDDEEVVPRTADQFKKDVSVSLGTKDKKQDAIRSHVGAPGSSSPERKAPAAVDKPGSLENIQRLQKEREEAKKAASSKPSNVNDISPSKSKD